MYMFSFGHLGLTEASPNRGFGAVVQISLETGADKNTQGERDGNALQEACASGKEVVANMLFERGTDVGIHNGMFSALHRAPSSGHSGTMRTLLVSDGIGESPMVSNAVDEYGQTAPLLAWVKGHTDAGQQIVALSVYLNVMNSHGETALSLAAKGCKEGPK